MVLRLQLHQSLFKKFLKAKRNKKKKHNKIAMLAISKLNSIKSKTSKALMDNKISMKTLRQLLMKKKK